MDMINVEAAFVILSNATDPDSATHCSKTLHSVTEFNAFWSTARLRAATHGCGLRSSNAPRNRHRKVGLMPRAQHSPACLPRPLLSLAAPATRRIPAQGHGQTCPSTPTGKAMQIGPRILGRRRRSRAQIPGIKTHSPRRQRLRLREAKARRASLRHRGVVASKAKAKANGSMLTGPQTDPRTLSGSNPPHRTRHSKRPRLHCNPACADRDPTPLVGRAPLLSQRKVKHMALRLSVHADALPSRASALQLYKPSVIAQDVRSPHICSLCKAEQRSQREGKGQWG